jgi:ABC-type glycerol-3-phosphate transport system substrate-binding protein
MKRSFFQIMLMVVFGAFAVAGILVFAFAVGGNSQGAGIGKVVIWGTLDKGAVNSMLDTAAQANPQLQQVSYVQKNDATYNQTISSALAQNAGPDMFIVSSDYATQNEPEVSSIPYAQLTVVQFQNIFAEAANVYLGGGGVIAIPFAVDPMVLYWNRDMLSSAGYAQPPATWETLQGMAPQLTVRDGSGNIQKSAIALGTYQNIGNAKADLSLLMLQEGSPIVTRDASGKLAPGIVAQNSGTASQAGEQALAFYTGFADPSQAYYSWNGAMQDARTAFAAGDTAFYVGYASEFPEIAAMNPNLNFTVAPIPQFKNANHSTDFGRVYAFAIPRVSTNPQGALLAAKLLDSATTTNALAASLGIAGARRDVLSMQQSGYAALFASMAIITDTWPDPDPVQTEALFRAMIEDTISGAATLPQALQSGDQQMSQILSPQQ